MSTPRRIQSVAGILPPGVEWPEHEANCTFHIILWFSMNGGRPSHSTHHVSSWPAEGQLCLDLYLCIKCIHTTKRHI